MDSIISLLGVVVAGLLTGLIGVASARTKFSGEKEYARWEADLERRQKQIDELYVPLQRLRAESSDLRDLVHDQKQGDWRTVHHIGDIKKAYEHLMGRDDQDPAEGDQAPVEGDQDPVEELGLSTEGIFMVPRIIEKGDAIVALLKAQDRLIEGVDGAVPPAIRKYRSHHVRLKAAWESGDNLPKDVGAEFPRELDGEIAAGRKAVEADLARLKTMEHSFGKPGRVERWLRGALVIGTVVVVAFAFGSQDATPHYLVNSEDGVICGTAEIGSNGEFLVVGQEVPGEAVITEVDRCS